MSRKSRKKAKAAGQDKVTARGKITTKTAAGKVPVTDRATIKGLTTANGRAKAAAKVSKTASKIPPPVPSPKSIERAHEIDGFKAELVSLQGKLKASDIKVKRLTENRTQLQHDLSVATESDNMVEQLRVQLAGCGVVALGGTKDQAKKGDYGWSVSYQDCLDLRLQSDAQKEVILKFEAELNATVVSESTADAKLLGFFAVWATAGRPRFCSFPVIPTFGASGPEIDLKNQLNEDGDWQGFRLWQVDEAIIFEPYDAANSG